MHMDHDQGIKLHTQLCLFVSARVNEPETLIRLFTFFLSFFFCRSQRSFPVKFFASSDFLFLSILFNLNHAQCLLNLTNVSGQVSAHCFPYFNYILAERCKARCSWSSFILNVFVHTLLVLINFLF